MSGNKAFAAFLLLGLFLAAPLHAGEGEEKGESGEIFTFWPLVDYRESPKEGYRNISILGPLFKIQQWGNDRDIAIRPLFYERANTRNETASTDYLYPVASTETTPDVTTVQVLKLFQNNNYRKDEGEKQEKSTMLFPFYISGKSEKYGRYTSVFPFYGDIYERFWRDEYHYVLFPLYGRTVKKGTTTRNYLYPFFSTTTGEKESGFQFWPLYGEAAKEGVYSRRFVLWPFYLQENSGLDTDNPTEKRYFFPFYAATDSPQRSSRYYVWPFFGHSSDTVTKEEVRDYFWPFLWTARGERRTVDSYLPFYSREEGKERIKRWYLWPLYKHEELNSLVLRQESDRILYFLYSNSRESWPQDDKEKRRTAFWPLFVYNRDTRGVSSLTMPAPVEPVFNKDGVERSWAPLWRLYHQRWNDRGDSAASFLWNLYWHEVRGDDFAYEFFPLLSYRSEKSAADFKFFKGLLRYRNSYGEKSFTFLWLPLGMHWGKADEGVRADAATRAHSPEEQASNR
ncbi:MAG: hypothetical protein FD174_4254 [Geobacteraceae bacterium]|nr:MAG: hypothetical protein FD174_4254 [Geobacteraceae bacterium]